VAFTCINGLQSCNPDHSFELLGILEAQERAVVTRPERSGDVGLGTPTDCRYFVVSTAACADGRASTVALWLVTG
jgi:hypothetical protein